MQHLTEHMKRQAPEPREYGEKETAIVAKLFDSMKANYGGLFLASLDDEKTQEIWERSWKATIAGKRTEVVAKALTHCLDTHEKPFTRADFQEAYRSLLPKAMHQRNRDALALPSKTFAERKAMAQAMLARARELIGPEPEKKPKAKPKACDRRHFAEMGCTALDYPQGEYEGRLGQLPPEFFLEKAEELEEKKAATA